MVLGAWSRSLLLVDSPLLRRRCLSSKDASKSYSPEEDDENPLNDCICAKLRLADLAAVFAEMVVNLGEKRPPIQLPELELVDER